MREFIQLTTIKYKGYSINITKIVDELLIQYGYAILKNKVIINEDMGFNTRIGALENAKIYINER